jgi:putative hydrolase of the HAD superfamily
MLSCTLRFTTFFFDLDDTLYPPSTGLWEAIAGRINLYMIEKMGLTPEQAVSTRQKYFREFGTTLRGLQANHKIDTDDYLAFVHDVPLDQYIHLDPNLRAAIEGLPGRKFIFTNSDTPHAGRVLNAVGLQGLFDGIIDVHTIAPYCKPMPEAFGLALKAAGSPDPHTCVLLDDQERITKAASALGFHTILVGKESPNGNADAALLHLADLPGLLEGQL